MKAKNVICPNPNCGYKGPSRPVSKGDVLIFLLLTILGVIPGLIYALACGGYIYLCPVCKTKCMQD